MPGYKDETEAVNTYFRANYFNYINMTTHDPSGMLRFLTDELQAAEDAHERGTLHIPFTPREKKTAMLISFVFLRSSMDHGSRPQRVGRDKRTGEPDRSLYVQIFSCRVSSNQGATLYSLPDVSIPVVYRFV
jgi:hypothetical protein